MKSILFYIFFTLMLASGIGLIHIAIILMCNPAITTNDIIGMIVTIMIGMIIAIISIAAIVYKISEDCKQ